MKTLRYAIIGTGGIANQHLKGFSSQPAVDIVGLSDPAPAALERVSKNFPKAFASLNAKEMLIQSRPDIVSICTPNKFHMEHTLAALNAGAHVVCEKPMAMTLKEAETMETARKKAGKFGLINFSYRSKASFRFAKELIRKGDLGAITRINVVYLQSFLGAESQPYSWRNNVDLAGFGAMGDLGIHMIDAATFITGETFKKVVGRTQTLIKEKKDTKGKKRKITTDTNACFIAEFDNGMLGMFETTQIAPGYGNYFSIDISGTKGTITVYSDKEEFKLHAGNTISHYNTWKTDLPEFLVPTGFMGKMPPTGPAAMVNVIRDGLKDYPSFKDGLATQKVLTALLKSNQSGKWEKM